MQGDKPIAFEGRKMTSPETRYTVGEQELLAVHHALQIWRCYIEGSNHPITVVTDHAPNTWLDTQPNLSRRHARWSEFLQWYKLIWQYRPGRTNVADPLSRNPAYLSALQNGGQTMADAFESVGEAIQAGYLVDSKLADDSFVSAYGFGVWVGQRWRILVQG